MLTKSLDFPSTYHPLLTQLGTKGNCLTLYSLDYDLARLTDENNYNSYRQYVSQESTTSGTSIVINLSVDDLEKEYERLKNLNIGKSLI